MVDVAEPGAAGLGPLLARFEEAIGPHADLAGEDRVVELAVGVDRHVALERTAIAELHRRHHPAADVEAAVTDAAPAPGTQVRHQLDRNAHRHVLVQLAMDQADRNDEVDGVVEQAVGGPR